MILCTSMDDSRAGQPTELLIDTLTWIPVRRIFYRSYRSSQIWKLVTTGMFEVDFYLLILLIFWALTMASLNAATNSGDMTFATDFSRVLIALTILSTRPFSDECMLS